VLVAVGRAPRTSDLGLDKTSIKPDRGFIPTNEWMETTEPGIYAIGDIVAGMPLLAHSGSMAGLVVAARMAASTPRRQPLAHSRLHLHRAADRQRRPDRDPGQGEGLPGEGGQVPFVGNSKATILDAHDGFVKVVADAKHGEILGVHIIGPTRRRSSRRRSPRSNSRPPSRR